MSPATMELEEFLKFVREYLARIYNEPKLLDIDPVVLLDLWKAQGAIFDFNTPLNPKDYAFLGSPKDVTFQMMPSITELSKKLYRRGLLTFSELVFGM
jgi:hypothetical protein